MDSSNNPITELGGKVDLNRLNRKRIAKSILDEPHWATPYAGAAIFTLTLAGASFLLYKAALSGTIALFAILIALNVVSFYEQWKLRRRLDAIIELWKIQEDEKQRPSCLRMDET